MNRIYVSTLLQYSRSLYPMHKIIIGPTWIQPEIFRKINDEVSIQLLKKHKACSFLKKKKHKACLVNKSYLLLNQVPPT